jgi:hypothetical protein
MNATIRLRKEVPHGGNIPPGWQMAWYEPRRRIGVYYPAPLHWILRAIRELAYRLRVALHAPAIERAEVFQMQRMHRERELLADQYVRGYLVGWRECFETCMQTVEEELVHVDEVWDVNAILARAPKPRHEN